MLQNKIIDTVEASEATRLNQINSQAPLKIKVSRTRIQSTKSESTLEFIKLA